MSSEGRVIFNISPNSLLLGRINLNIEKIDYRLVKDNPLEHRTILLLENGIRKEFCNLGTFPLREKRRNHIFYVDAEDMGCSFIVQVVSYENYEAASAITPDLKGQ